MSHHISITNILVSNITRNTADISWTTGEESDSQVEYWSSPSLLTTLDPTLVTTHLVHLANLTAETTHYFKVMLLQNNNAWG